MPPKPIRWGFLGTGSIARGFADGLKCLPEAALVAVGSRSGERSREFVERYATDWAGIRAYGSYRELLADDAVDVVYIATTHESHVALARAAIAHGKAVLIEKPVGLHGDEVRQLVREARAAGVFCMEAMWTRFIPAVQELQRRLDAGVIGSLRLIQADFGIDLGERLHAGHRMLDPSIGGGALWDLGIYPLTFARVLAKAPAESLSALPLPATETGVDEFVALQLRYPGGLVAQLSCGFRLRTPHQARLYGTQGRIVVDDFFHPKAFTIYRDDAEPELVNCPFTGPGYQFEAAEVMRCLRAGLTDSPLCPLDETAELIDCMAGLYRAWGVCHPPSTMP